MVGYTLIVCKCLYSYEYCLSVLGVREGILGDASVCVCVGVFTSMLFTCSMFSSHCLSAPI